MTDHIDNNKASQLISEQYQRHYALNDFLGCTNMPGGFNPLLALRILHHVQAHPFTSVPCFDEKFTVYRHCNWLDEAGLIEIATTDTLLNVIARDITADGLRYLYSDPSILKPPGGNGR